MNQHSLEPRLAAALGNPNLGVAELSELIIAVEGAAASADQSVAAERDKALDMLASSDIAAAHEAVAVAQLSRDRVHAVLPKLRERLSAALNAEQRDRWLEDYRRVKAQRDEAVAAFKHYPSLAEKIVHLFATAAAVDREVSRVNGSAPDGEHRRLKEVELKARNVESFSRDNPSIAKAVQLPDWGDSAKMVWPPPQPSLAVQVATSMTYGSHPGGDWWQQREERAQAMREEQERVAAFYEAQVRRREERENADAASVAASRRSGS